jgi:antitoxin VapB
MRPIKTVILLSIITSTTSFPLQADLTIKRMTEKEILDGLDAEGAHADALAGLLPDELEPLERLRGSIKRYIQPTDPVWDEYFDSDEGVTDDFMGDRDQPSPEKR